MKNPALDKTFELGVVVVTVTTTGGSSTIEDWDPDDREEAKEYAAETALCDDVSSVNYYDGLTGETLSFVHTPSNYKPTPND